MELDDTAFPSISGLKRENGCILKATNHGKFYPAPTEDVEDLVGTLD